MGFSSWQALRKGIDKQIQECKTLVSYHVAHKPMFNVDLNGVAFKNVAQDFIDWQAKCTNSSNRTPNNNN